MRQGRDNDILLIDGKLVGINLGADYCAEHEWGIAGIQSDFGIDKSKLGLEGRKVSSVPPNLTWLSDFKLGNNTKDKARWSGIYFGYEPETPYINASAYGDVSLVTAWSERDFAVISTDVTKAANIKEVFEAFKQLDVAMWRGGGGVFQNAGLCFGIASRLSKTVTDNWYTVDNDNRKLKAEVADTGIEKLLKDAGRSYFALSPSRQKDGSIKFWLNPMEQNQNNCGWYTIQDLKEWVQNKGPIPKRKH